MKCLRFLPLLLIPILFAGCQAVSRQDRTVLQAHNVPPDVYDKMLYGDPLSPDDVITLAQRAVPAGLIIHYMQDTDTIYVLRKPEVKRLRAAGVNEEIIAYMLSTAPAYGPYGPGPYAGYPYPGPAYPYGPYPYGYYDGLYAGPVFYVGGWGGGGWGRGGWGHGGWGGGHRR